MNDAAHRTHDRSAIPEDRVSDRETICAILDAGLLYHVDFVEAQQPFVIPMLYVRVGEQIYLLGSPRSRQLQPCESDVALCLTVTHVDGLVWHAPPSSMRSTIAR